MSWGLSSNLYEYWWGYNNNSWGCSSVGRALDLHSRGLGFNSPQLHIFIFSILLQTSFEIVVEDCLNALFQQQSASFLNFPKPHTPHNNQNNPLIFIYYNNAQKHKNKVKAGSKDHLQKIPTFG